MTAENGKEVVLASWVHVSDIHFGHGDAGHQWDQQLVGADGHFNPHVAAHSTRPEWLVVTSLGFASVVGQVLSE